jgi:hypothetical protein
VCSIYLPTLGTYLVCWFLDCAWLYTGVNDYVMEVEVGLGVARHDRCLA